jgi:tRNA 2-selenouridine synthase
VVRELLVHHYDPVYVQSMQRNFAQYGASTRIAPANRSLTAMRLLAAQLLAAA